MKRVSNKVLCPVCGKTEFQSQCDYDICKFCGWENDNWFEGGGANDLSLAEYEKRYDMYVYLNPRYTWTSNGYPELNQTDRCSYWHQYSTSNQQRILSSKRCGCFFCNKIFESNLVFEYYMKDKNGPTAICPFCGVDSLLPDSSVELSLELLKDMHSIWFE